MKTQIYILKGIQLAFAILALFLMSCTDSKKSMSGEEKYELLYGDKKEEPKEEVEVLIDDETQEEINKIAEDIGKGAGRVAELLEESGILDQLFSSNTKLIESKEGVYTIQELEISKDNKILVQATYHKKNSFNIIKTIIVWDREVQERYSVLDDLKYDVNLSVTSYTKGKVWEEISTVDYIERDWNLDEEDADKFLKNNFKDAVSVFNKVVQHIAERSTE